MLVRPRMRCRVYHRCVLRSLLFLRVARLWCVLRRIRSLLLLHLCQFSQHRWLQWKQWLLRRLLLLLRLLRPSLKCRLRFSLLRLSRLSR